MAEPWEIISRETSHSKREYWRQYRDGANSLHPSCGDTTPTPPEWVEERTITYREERGGRDRARNTGRGDRERRRGMPRQEGRRDRNRRDQERAREEARRQRDRGDRANRDRRGPKKD